MEHTHFSAHVTELSKFEQKLIRLHFNWKTCFYTIEICDCIAALVKGDVFNLFRIENNNNIRKGKCD